MKRYFLIALALLLALLAPGLSLTEMEINMEETLPKPGMVPFLCVDWADAAQDADLCRGMQPVNNQAVTPQGQPVGYRLVLEKVGPELVTGGIYVDGGLPQVLELVWNCLTQSLTEAGLTAEGQSFTGGYCRISLRFTGADTVTLLQVMNEPSGSCIRFRCQPNTPENQPLSGDENDGSV